MADSKGLCEGKGELLLLVILISWCVCVYVAFMCVKDIGRNLSTILY